MPSYVGCSSASVISYADPPCDVSSGLSTCGLMVPKEHPQLGRVSTCNVAGSQRDQRPLVVETRPCLLPGVSFSSYDGHRLRRASLFDAGSRSADDQKQTLVSLCFFFWWTRIGMLKNSTRSRLRAVETSYPR